MGQLCPKWVLVEANVAEYVRLTKSGRFRSNLAEIGPDRATFGRVVPNAGQLRPVRPPLGVFDRIWPYCGTLAREGAGRPCPPGCACVRVAHASEIAPDLVIWLTAPRARCGKTQLCQSLSVMAQFPASMGGANGKARHGGEAVSSGGGGEAARLSCGSADVSTPMWRYHRRGQLPIAGSTWPKFNGRPPTAPCSNDHGLNSASKSAPLQPSGLCRRTWPHRA